MLKLDASTSRTINQFFQWWGSELVSLIPLRLRNILVPQRPKLVLTRTGESAVHLTLVHEGQERDLGQIPFDHEGTKQRATLYSEIPELGEAETVFKLAPDQALLRVVKLPAAAEENLQQVVAFELDRWTPFKADQAYLSTRVVERLEDARQIRVELALTPKAKLDPSLDEIIGAGWRLDRVDIGPEAAGHGMDLLPERFKPHRSKVPQILTASSALLFVLLFASVFVLPIAMNRSIADDLRLEVKKAGKVADDVEGLKKDVERQRDEQNFLSRKKQTEPTMLEMLNELTKVLPDDTWLNGLQYRDRKVTVQGQSPAASSLIERIEGSDVFKNTSFVSPVTKDVASGQERFQITSEVTRRGPSEKPTE